MRYFTWLRFKQVKNYLNAKTSIYRHITYPAIKEMAKSEYKDFKRQLNNEVNWMLAKE